MDSLWIKLHTKDVESCGYNMRLVALIFALFNPAASVRDIQAGAGVSKRYAHEAWSQARRGRDKNGTKTGHANQPPQPFSSDSRDKNGTKTGQPLARARGVFDFGSGTTKATTETTTTDPPTPKGGKVPGDFLTFWKAYPRKVGKLAAIKAWLRQKPPIDAVLAALEWQRGDEQWVKDGGQFIPHPSTYLNNRRWEDERQTFNDLLGDPTYGGILKE